MRSKERVLELLTREELLEVVERYDPSRESAILLEVATGYQVLILTPEGYDYVGGLTFEGYGLLGASMR
jgi:hypothetical protein